MCNILPYCHGLGPGQDQPCPAASHGSAGGHWLHRQHLDPPYLPEGESEATEE